MENHDHSQVTIPADCFTLAELETFQSFAGQILTDVNYYVWLNHADQGNVPLRFLYFLELTFETNEALLITSGEDSSAIKVSDAGTLVKTAETLRSLHGQVVIQRVSAGNLDTWKPAIGQALASVNLTRNEEGLYYNDALQFDFNVRRVEIYLSKHEGLELIAD
jgi:hypothetical protein